jgi:surface carbohydrate biosynthesis protein
MNQHPATIIMPVESQVRELDAKLLLSCLLAEKGFPVVFGSRAFVHFLVEKLPRGVYMAKSMRTLSIRMFTILRQLGHEIVAWDEEGLVRWPDEEYYRWRLSPVTLKLTNQLLAWGEDDARVLKNYPGYPGTPIHITGNPRIDLLRPELRDFYRERADRLVERFGDFVLINTNFSKVNHFFSHLSELKKPAEQLAAGGIETFDAGKGRLKQQLFEHFLAMLPELCRAVSGHTVVVRPHPAENHGPWLEVAARCPNLKIINEDSVTPWLMAARLLIANGCTTMIESAVLGTPTIAYQPVMDPRYDDDLPNLVSHRAFTLDDLLAQAEAVMAGDLGAVPEEDRRRVLDRHLAALDGPLAGERIVKVLEEAGYLDDPPLPAPAADFVRGFLHNKVRTLGKKINKRRPGHR